MFRWIVDYRKRREVDPTLSMLRETVAELEQSQEDTHTKGRLREMLDLFETADSLYAQAQNVPTHRIVGIARIADVVSKLLKFFPA